MLNYGLSRCNINKTGWNFYDEIHVQNVTAKPLNLKREVEAVLGIATSS